MGTHLTKLKSIIPLARDTYHYHFEKPEGFSFIPGQFVRITLTHTPETDWKIIRRDFSIANAPHEDDIVIAVRYRDSFFKQQLHTLPPDQTIQMEGPLGTLKLHDDPEQPVVFIAGGIGIAPFRCMVLHAMTQQSGHRMFLFAANPFLEYATYMEEMYDLTGRHEQFTFIPLVTREEKNWSGERGYLTQEMLKKYIPDLLRPMYYIVGPVQMVLSTKKTLREAGVPADQIVFEIFTGY